MAKDGFDCVNLDRLLFEFKQHSQPIFKVFYDRILLHGIAYIFKYSFLADDCVYIISFLVTKNLSCFYYIQRWEKCEIYLISPELHEFNCNVYKLFMHDEKNSDILAKNLRISIADILPKNASQLTNSSAVIINYLFNYCKCVPISYDRHFNFTGELKKIELAEKAKQDEIIEKAKQVELEEKLKQTDSNKNAKQDKNVELVDIIDRSELKKREKKEKKNKKEEATNDMMQS